MHALRAAQLEEAKFESVAYAKSAQHSPAGSRRRAYEADADRSGGGEASGDEDAGSGCERE